MNKIDDDGGDGDRSWPENVIALRKQWYEHSEAKQLWAANDKLIYFVPQSSTERRSFPPENPRYGSRRDSEDGGDWTMNYPYSDRMSTYFDSEYMIYYMWY